MTKLMGVHMFATGNSYGERAPLARNYIIAKRVLDLLIAGTALVMFSPLLAFICIGIKLEGRSQAVLVRQRAVSTGGEFAIYKFATTASQRGFRRVTRVGALLQNTSMDELPQLLNVLCGQMSMVGPRPRVVDPKRNCHNPMHHATQHHIKPGIIGWAQINRFRSETARVDRVNQSTDVEHWYINNWSIWLDLRILLRAMVYPA
jgi:lipopolysaccharide/colanic/teichoic acid biosynthesis glycosyltransferase